MTTIAYINVTPDVWADGQWV